MRPGAEALGGLFVAAGAVQFGAVVVLGKIVSRRGIPVPAMLAVRFGIAAVLLGSVLGVLRRGLRAASGEGWKLIGLGAVGYALESALFFLALERGSASAVTLLFFTYPVWVALLSVALGLGRPGWLVGSSLAAALAGAALVITSAEGLDISTAGVGFALGSSLTFSCYLIGAEVVLKRTSSLSGAMYVSIAASVALAGFAAASGQAELPEGLREWGPVLGMGGFTAGAFFCLFAGLRLLGAVRTAIVAALEPVATAGLAMLFLDERLRTGTAIGGVLILAGAVAASVARRAPEQEPGVP